MARIIGRSYTLSAGGSPSAVARDRQRLLYKPLKFGVIDNFGPGLRVFTVVAAPRVHIDCVHAIDNGSKAMGWASLANFGDDGGEHIGLWELAWIKVAAVGFENGRILLTTSRGSPSPAL
jgi:hypothetical protein